eukprot:NODE_83_length_3417_cov_23.994359_g74_i0.p1 GENE.NODE_83_length_3417_cov_23.994359_g74_i0~~NODE_83_length_3417_cov_23.994359_g74_i0.p1  ORF type:complete len:1052 (+),score=205.62 NODE_83_length_3417_cov_23.994359_g74_i0:139-3294(+)
MKPWESSLRPSAPSVPQRRRTASVGAATSMQDRKMFHNNKRISDDDESAEPISSLLEIISNLEQQAAASGGGKRTNRFVKSTAGVAHSSSAGRPKARCHETSNREPLLQLSSNLSIRTSKEDATETSSSASAAGDDGLPESAPLQLGKQLLQLQWLLKQEQQQNAQHEERLLQKEQDLCALQRRLDRERQEASEEAKRQSARSTPDWSTKEVELAASLRSMTLQKEELVQLVVERQMELLSLQQRVDEKRGLWQSNEASTQTDCASVISDVDGGNGTASLREAELRRELEEEQAARFLERAASQKSKLTWEVQEGKLHVELAGTRSKLQEALLRLGEADSKEASWKVERELLMEEVANARMQRADACATAESLLLEVEQSRRCDQGVKKIHSATQSESLDCSASSEALSAVKEALAAFKIAPTSVRDSSVMTQVASTLEVGVMTSPRFPVPSSSVMTSPIRCAHSNAGVMTSPRCSGLDVSVMTSPRRLCAADASTMSSPRHRTTSDAGMMTFNATSDASTMSSPRHPATQDSSVMACNATEDVSTMSSTGCLATMDFGTMTSPREHGAVELGKCVSDPVAAEKLLHRKKLGDLKAHHNGQILRLWREVLAELGRIRGAQGSLSEISESLTLGDDGDEAPDRCGSDDENGTSLEGNGCDCRNSRREYHRCDVLDKCRQICSGDEHPKHRLQAEIEAISREREDFIAQVSHLTQLLQDKEDEHLAVTEDHALEVEAMRQRLTNLMSQQEKFKEMVIQAREMESKNRRRRVTFADLPTSEADLALRKNLDDNGRIKELEELVASERSHFEREFQQACERETELRGYLEKAAHHIDHIEKELSAQQEKAKCLQVELESARADLMRIRSEVGETAAAMEATCSALQNAENAKDELERTVANLRDRWLRSRDEMLPLRSELEGAELRCEKLKNDKLKLKHNSETYRRRWEEERGRAELLKRLLQQAEERITELSASMRQEMPVPWTPPQWSSSKSAMPLSTRKMNDTSGTGSKRPKKPTDELLFEILLHRKGKSEKDTADTTVSERRLRSRSCGAP